MKTISKLLITGLIAASISPAAYAADAADAAAFKCGSNTITYNSKTNKLCINGKYITPDAVINGSLSGCIPFNILGGIINCTNGSCTITPIIPNVPVQPDTPQEPEATEAPDAPQEPEATEVPDAPQEPEATEVPDVPQEPEATEAPTAAPTQEPEPAPTELPGESTNASAAEREVFSLVNQVRAENGLSALTWADDLADVARAHSRDMINRGFFSHTNPDGYSPFDRLRNNGISYRTAAENIAYGQKTPQAVMNAWMNSSGHRANILNANVKEIGVGAATAPNGTIYWTQMFIAR